MWKFWWSREVKLPFFSLIEFLDNKIINILLLCYLFNARSTCLFSFAGNVRRSDQCLECFTIKELYRNHSIVSLRAKFFPVYYFHMFCSSVRFAAIIEYLFCIHIDDFVLICVSEVFRSEQTFVWEQGFIFRFLFIEFGIN